MKVDFYGYVCLTAFLFLLLSNNITEAVVMFAAANVIFAISEIKGK